MPLPKTTLTTALRQLKDNGFEWVMINGTALEIEPYIKVLLTQPEADQKLFLCRENQIIAYRPDGLHDDEVTIHGHIPGDH